MASIIKQFAPLLKIDQIKEDKRILTWRIKEAIVRLGRCGLDLTEHQELRYKLILCLTHALLPIFGKCYLCSFLKSRREFSRFGKISAIIDQILHFFRNGHQTLTHNSGPKITKFFTHALSPIFGNRYLCSFLK